MSDSALISPELMAPAGDWDCARAAVENGADAVYFGLQGSLNARARAVNFSETELPELMTFLHTRGVKGYLTLNTLVFRDELAEAERAARIAVAAGVDAVLVQDLGLLRLLHRLCESLPLHASTQMTLSSAECLDEIESLGVRRVVLPRELSIDEIAAVRRQTSIELEAFVHGALCISYSGQCLASHSLGGRSANRGQCAQPCRLPYEAMIGDKTDGRGFLLSPHDLAAHDRVPQLMAAGVSAFKIEGRLKPAEYVASVTRHYRTVIDAAYQSSLSQEPRQEVLSSDDIAEMEMTFSRGFGHGWLDGADHRALVSGRSSAKRGTLLGTVRGVRGQHVVVELSGPVRRGDGVVFEGDQGREGEQGGRVYEIFQGRQSVTDAPAGGTVELAFRNDTMDFATIQPDGKLWKTDDPRAARRLRKTYAAGPPRRRTPVDIVVEASVGNALRMKITAATGVVCEVTSPEPLAAAFKHPLTVELLTEQFGRLGGTPYKLRHVEAALDGRAIVPLSVLGKLRHEMVRLLDATAAAPTPRTIIDDSALTAIRNECSAVNHAHPVCLHVLCRSMDQLRAALGCGVSSVIADFEELSLHGEAVRTAHAAGTAIWLATPRIHKPGESAVFEQLAQERPDGVLARNLAALRFFRRAGLPMVADFSLNAVNDLSIEWLRSQGAMRVTAAHDLSARQLLDLATAVPPQSLEVVVHGHVPMFHTEYCLFCGLLSKGRNKVDCGHPCRCHSVRLRDRLGVEHPLVADSQCRNTLFHASAESLANVLPALLDRGVRHFRVELLLERSEAEVRKTLAPYQHVVDFAS